jgi:wyosine [tRNA(Phe)-imidazoG37] synthetase (radical SAM superfamily)
MSVFVFGPVPSRRLGRSLGIDPVPLKTCNWNCVYCQLGRSVPVTNERKDYWPPGQIVAEVRRVLQTRSEREIDWVTFLASGEPTLHASLGRMIRDVKAITQIPVAVITNGALLYRPDVQEDLMAADAVLPSLDAGTAALYRAINRPHPECTFDRLVNGLLEFRRAYQGKMWVEVMVVKGLNDTEEALRDLAGLFHKLQPDQVHLTTPVRPPAEPWVEPPDEQGMQRARSFLREWVQPEGPGAGIVKLSGIESLPDALVAVVSRHPMTEAELLRLLPDRSREEVHRALSQLLESGRLQVVERYGQQFWASGRSRYG